MDSTPDPYADDARPWGRILPEAETAALLAAEIGCTPVQARWLIDAVKAARSGDDQRPNAIRLVRARRELIERGAA